MDPETTYTAPQPSPIQNSGSDVWFYAIGNLMTMPDAQIQDDPMFDRLLEDCKNRRQFGMHKYHTPLQMHNGRIPLVDLYQELLDAIAYANQEKGECLPDDDDVEQLIRSLVRSALVVRSRLHYHYGR